MQTPKRVDNKGRITLGKEYANALVLIEKNSKGVIHIKPAEVVPAEEAWLYKNKAALASVLKGMEQAKSGEFAKEAFDLDRDDDWLKDVD